MRDFDLKAALCGYLLLLCCLHWASSCTVTKFKDSTIQMDSPGATANNIPQPAASVATGAGADATTITKPRAAVVTGDSSSAQDNRKAGQRAGNAATGKGSVASSAPKIGLPWWWPVIVVLLVLVILNKLIRGRWLL